MDMLVILIVVVSQLYTYVKINQILYFKYIQCITHQLYFNKVVFKNLTNHSQRLHQRGGSGGWGSSETKVLSSFFQEQSYI